MAVNTRTEYALRALLEIADAKEKSVSAQAISERQLLPKKYIEHLLSALKKADLIRSSSGSRGGYTLARPASRINLYDVLVAVEDETPVLSCVMEGNFCLGSACGLKALFNEVSNKQKRLYQSYTLSKIRRLRAQEAK